MLRNSGFKAPWWLRNRHLQTMVPNSPLRRLAPARYFRETVELPDGDFLDVDWTHRPEPGDARPVVVVLHGLEGSSQSRYVTAVMAVIQRAG